MQEVISRSLRFRNFMSYGNDWTNIIFDNGVATFVMGENHDDGGNNGCGKCVLPDTLINIRNKNTGEILQVTIGDLYGRQKGLQDR